MLLERLLGRKPQETREPEPAQLSEIKLPLKLDRKYYLLYLLSVTAAEGNFARDIRRINYREGFYHESLTRDQIEKLAQVLYADTLQNRPRPLAEAVADAQILDDAKLEMVRKDPVLGKISLVYSQQEMEVSLDPIKIGDSYSYPEWHAGSGPARPLLLDLYSLSISSDFELIKKGQNEVSGISLGGADFTNVMRNIFARNRSFQESDVVLEVGKYSQELAWRNQPPSVPAVV